MADSSHNDVFVDDVLDDVFVDSDIVVVGPTVDLDVGTPGTAKHRTALGSTNSVDLVYWGASSPYAPYDVQPIFILWNRFGKYVFGKIQPHEDLTAVHLYAESTLLSVSSLRFQASTDPSNLPGTVNAGQRPTATATLSNATGIWNMRVNEEAWLLMSAGYFSLVRGLWTIPRLTGVVIDMELTDQDTVVIEFGAFTREQPPPGSILVF